MFYAVLRDRIAALTAGRPEPRTVHAATPHGPGGHGLATAGHTNAEAFQAVCRMLDDRHGRKIPNTPQGTLNRLFRKHLATHQPALADAAPDLTDENVWVTRETRPKLSFVGLSRRLETGPKISVDGGHPIVIARYRGLDLLLDGNKRCRYWYKHADSGLHDAYVLVVRETGRQ
jgi:hypothetical protein